MTQNIHGARLEIRFIENDPEQSWKDAMNHWRAKSAQQEKVYAQMFTRLQKLVSNRKGPKMSNFFEKWAGEDTGRQKLVFEEKFILNVTENIWEEMQRLGVNKVQLAERLGKSKAYVSQLLNGNRNMTLRTLAGICFVLGVENPQFIIGEPVNLLENGYPKSRDSVRDESCRRVS